MFRVHKLRWLLIIPIFAGAVFLGLRSRPVETEPAAPPPITVPVSRGAVVQSVLAPGQLVSTRERVLSLEAGGRLDTIAVRPGTRVNGGDLIASQDDGTTLDAPFAGVIVDIPVRPGAVVAPGQPVALLVDPGALEVRVTVIEEDLPLVQVGQTAQVFFDAAPELIAAATVARIVPYRVPQADRPLFHVYLTLTETTPALAPGMTADAAITVAAVTDVLRLPRGVLRLSSDGRAQTQRLVDGSWERVTVSIGLRGDSYVEIVAGLMATDQVIGE